MLDIVKIPISTTERLFHGLIAQARGIALSFSVLHSLIISVSL